jgi:hypothetical protein
MEKRNPEPKKMTNTPVSNNKITSIGEARKAGEIREKQENLQAVKVGVAPTKQKNELDKKRVMFYLSNSLVNKMGKIAKNKGYSSSEYLE